MKRKAKLAAPVRLPPAAPVAPPARPRERAPHESVRIAEAVADFLKGFTASLPPGAETGVFHATAHDRFAGQAFDIPDGRYSDGVWLVRFAGGRFVHAIHHTRQAFFAGVPERLTAAASA